METPPDRPAAIAAQSVATATLAPCESRDPALWAEGPIRLTSLAFPQI